MDATLKNLIQQIEKVEHIDDDLLEGLYFGEGEGQYYSGVRISNNTILVLMQYEDRFTYTTEYFHYDITGNELVKLDDESDNYYRELFEDCHMLDCVNAFFIMGIDENLKLVYGSKYNDKIINLKESVK